MPRGISHALWTILACLLLCMAAGPLSAAPPAGPRPPTVLRLVNGSQATGVLAPSDDPAFLRWQSPAFTAPFQFEWSHVDAVNFPLPADLPEPKGEFRFELANGDALHGELAQLGASDLLVDAPTLGRLHVRRDRIVRIDRWRNGQGVIYLGPRGLSGWKASSPGSWRDELGCVLTDQPNTFIERNFHLPAKASIELELSWKKKAEFSLALGVDDEASVSRAFRVESWDGDLVLLREETETGNIALVKTISSGAGRVHLRLFLDQEAGRCLAFSDRGEPLADLTVAEKQPKVRPGLRLSNKTGGDIRLERLRIGRWNGEVPSKVESEKSRLHLVDGTIVYGLVSSFDAAARELVLRGEAGESRVPLEKVATIALAPPKEEPPRNLTVTLADSSRLSGELVNVDEKSLWLSSPDLREPLTLPLAELQSLEPPPRKAAEVKADGRTGTLEIDGTNLRGWLVDGKTAPGPEPSPAGSSAASPLVWQPEGSKTASPLRADVRGRIVYRDPSPPPSAAKPRVKAFRIARPGNVADVIIQEMTGAPSAPTPGRVKSLYLRTGDTIPCEVTGIDEHGLSFKSPFAGAHFVPHDKIKAVELTIDGAGTALLTQTKRDRLLTLPRLQKENPPTHMIRSRNGDYLRGRILSMNDTRLLVEVRLETREVPRNRVSRIIWLHPEDLAEADTPQKAEDPPSAMRVHALRSDGIRMTFIAEQVAGGTLSGKSDVLGPVRVDLAKVDQVVIGGEIEQVAARLAFQQWKLQNAVEPKFVSEGGDEGSEGRPSGMESALVGKPAPDFELGMLDGKKFRLSKSRGRIVILDFWATWCGPCVQALPQVDQVHREFAGRNVEVIAVNLEETPKAIAPMLERHKLELPVALDQDGAIAARYGVTSIPQTLVINAEGTVVRHFIGGGPHLGESLQAILKELLEGPSPGKTADETPSAGSGNAKDAP
jgi:peroxiredoxin